MKFFAKVFLGRRVDYFSIFWEKGGIAPHRFMAFIAAFNRIVTKLGEIKHYD